MTLPLLFKRCAAGFGAAVAIKASYDASTVSRRFRNAVRCRDIDGVNHIGQSWCRSLLQGSDWKEARIEAARSNETKLFKTVVDLLPSSVESKFWRCGASEVAWMVQHENDDMLSLASAKTGFHFDHADPEHDRMWSAVASRREKLSVDYYARILKMPYHVGDGFVWRRLYDASRFQNHVLFDSILASSSSSDSKRDIRDVLHEVRLLAVSEGSVEALEFLDSQPSASPVMGATYEDWRNKVQTEARRWDKSIPESDIKKSWDDKSAAELKKASDSQQHLLLQSIRCKQADVFRYLAAKATTEQMTRWSQAIFDVAVDSHDVGFVRVVLGCSVVPSNTKDNLSAILDMKHAAERVY